jgi:hypothetical protein
LAGHDAELGGVHHGGIDLGDVEPLLGRYAASDETGASGALLLDESHLEPEVVGVEGSGISTGAAAHYDDVCQI